MKTYAPLMMWIVLAACGAKPPVAATSTSSAPIEKPAESEPRAKAVDAPPPSKPAGDPLGMDGAVGALPEVVFTPRGELRRNGLGDLKEALSIATHEAAPDAAAAKLTRR